MKKFFFSICVSLFFRMIHMGILQQQHATARGHPIVADDKIFPSKSSGDYLIDIHPIKMKFPPTVGTDGRSASVTRTQLEFSLADFFLFSCFCMCVEMTVTHRSDNMAMGWRERTDMESGRTSSDRSGRQEAMERKKNFVRNLLKMIFSQF